MPKQVEQFPFDVKFLRELGELMNKYRVKSITPVPFKGVDDNEDRWIKLLKDGRLSIQGMMVDCFDRPMTREDAIRILSLHLMQCGHLMPADWIQKNGDGSEFMLAYEMAMEALKNNP